MSLTYSSAFKEQALVKVYSRGDRTIQSVAEDLNVKLHTLKIWMKRKMKQAREELPGSVKEKRPQDWRVDEQFQALQETYGLTGEALNAWCRERGLFAHLSPAGKPLSAVFKQAPKWRQPASMNDAILKMKIINSSAN